MPSFWTGGRLHQGAPVTATWRADGPDLRLAVHGTIGGLVASIELRLLAPTTASLTARVAAHVTGHVPLDDRPGEAFKIVTLSSMRVSSTHWDASAADVDGRLLVIPARGWIGHPPAIASALGLRGGTSAWKLNAPTIAIMLDRPLPCLGWVTPTADANDDNVALWAADEAMQSRWSYTVTAR
jgi:hypothetical protein